MSRAGRLESVGGMRGLGKVAGFCSLERFLTDIVLDRIGWLVVGMEGLASLCFERSKGACLS